MLLSLGTSSLMLAVISAALGVLGERILNRAGVGPLMLLWVSVAALLSALGTARVAAFESGFKYAPAREHPVWMWLLFTGFILVVLAPAMAMLLRRRARAKNSTASSSLQTTAIRSALLAVPGLLIALLVLLVLDVTGVRFIP